MKSTATLEVYKNGNIIFTSTGKWLHPLFDLEKFIKENSLSTEDLVIKDKVVGKASAMLIFRLGFGIVEAGILSMPARNFFSDMGISFTCKNLVDLIDCRTEIILKDIDAPEEAYKILKERADR